MSAIEYIESLATDTAYRNFSEFYVCSLEGLTTAREVQAEHQWKNSFKHVYLPAESHSILKYCFQLE